MLESQAAVPTMPQAVSTAVNLRLQCIYYVSGCSAYYVSGCSESPTAVPTMSQAAVPSLPESQAVSNVHERPRTVSSDRPLTSKEHYL